jgi:nitrogen fixation protein FixH
MKINWGWGITIAIILFMGFILFFVVKIQTNTAYDNELVVEDYYKQELNFQQTINKKQNAKDLLESVKITKSTEGILIEFPNQFNPREIKGTVSLYRPSNQKLDFEKVLSLSSSHLLIPTSELVSGRWDITLDWTYEGISYLSKEVIYL